MEKKYVIIIVVAIIIIIGALFLLPNTQGGSSQPASPAVTLLAQCLKDKGVTFYGAYWCPHCQAQKALFGDAAKLLPYVECSTPDGQSQTQACTDKGVKSYPTWVFPDGSRQEGEMTFEALAAKSGCPAPEASSTTATSTGTSAVTGVNVGASSVVPNLGTTTQ